MASRKTAHDGRLEISAAFAAHLATVAAQHGTAAAQRSTLEPQPTALAGEIPLTGIGDGTTAGLEALECRCAKAAGERHMHYFVVSPVFRRFTEGAAVTMELDAGTLRVI